MTVDTGTTSVGRGRLPWAFTAAALVAFGALWVTGKFFIGMPALGVLLVGSYFTKWRLPGGQVITWLVRVMVWGVLLAISPDRRPSGIAVIFDPNYVNLFGYFCAAELVLRVWTAGARGPSHGEVFLLSALVFTAATNTYERGHIHVLAPAYALCSVMAMRSFGVGKGEEGERRLPRRRGLVALRSVAMVVALGIAAGAVFGVTRYEYRITQWAVELLRQRANRAGEIGFSTQARLQAVFNPTPSMSRVLLVEGPVGERHLRVLAYDTYRESVWYPLMVERGFRAASPAGKAPTGGGRLVFTPLADLDGLLPLPLNTGHVEAEGSLEQDALGGMRAEDAGAGYWCTVPVSEVGQGPLTTRPNEVQRERLLAVPEAVDPKVGELARSVATARDAVGKLKQIEGHLRGKHKYSLSYQPVGEPISDFLLNQRAAHCQYFAAGVVMMARAVGVPARFVTGYYAHEAAGDDRVVVRERDAHAWAECWVEGAGWVTVDATPASGRPDVLFPKPSAWRQFWEWVRDLPRVVREWLGENSSRVLVVGGVPVMLVGVVWVVRRLLRKKVVVDREAYPAVEARLAAVAERFGKVLETRRVEVKAYRTWRELVAGEEAFRPFLDVYDGARFGGVTEGRVVEMERLLGELEREGAGSQ